MHPELAIQRRATSRKEIHHGDTEAQRGEGRGSLRAKNPSPDGRGGSRFIATRSGTLLSASSREYGILSVGTSRRMRCILRSDIQRRATSRKEIHHGDTEATERGGRGEGRSARKIPLPMGEEGRDLSRPGVGPYSARPHANMEFFLGWDITQDAMHPELATQRRATSRKEIHHGDTEARRGKGRIRQPSDTGISGSRRTRRESSRCRRDRSLRP